MKIEKETMELLEKYGISIYEFERNYKNEDCSVTVDYLDKLYGSILKKREKLKNLMEEPFKLEGTFAALNFEYFTLLKENQRIAINLSGALGHNKALRRSKHLEEKNYGEIEKLIEKYIFGIRI